jgi:hypothetical protein
MIAMPISTKLSLIQTSCIVDLAVQRVVPIKAVRYALKHKPMLPCRLQHQLTHKMRYIAKNPKVLFKVNGCDAGFYMTAGC